MEGLRTLLHGTGAWRVVAAERRPTDLLDAIREWSPGVAVFDRAFGLEPLLDALAALRNTGAPTAPVVWGVSISEADAVRLLQAGALGVVRKTCNLKALEECMSVAAGGGTWVEEGLIAAADAPPRTAPPPLTHRENQILEPGGAQPAKPGDCRCPGDPGGDGEDSSAAHFRKNGNPRALRPGALGAAGQAPGGGRGDVARQRRSGTESGGKRVCACGPRAVQTACLNFLGSIPYFQ